MRGQLLLRPALEMLYICARIFQKYQLAEVGDTLRGALAKAPGVAGRSCLVSCDCSVPSMSVVGRLASVYIMMTQTIVVV
jgi:hypothetical protein